MKLSKGNVLKLLAAAAAALLLAGPAASMATGEKTAVSITDVSVQSKTYDGTPVSPAGDPVITDAGGNPVTIASDGLVYAYASTDGGTYLSTTPPANAGAYALTISVSGGNATYEGSSDPIPFTISKAALSVNPDGGKTRYAGLSDPAFPFSCTGAVAGETPAFTGSLSGEATASSSEGVYGIAIGTLALSDNGAFLAANYKLSVVSGASYRVVNYPSDAAASLAATNLGTNDTYIGGVTLNAPDGYEIAFSSSGEWGSSVTKTDCANGLNNIFYYLRVSGGTYNGAITEQKMVSVKYDASAPGVSLYSPTADAAVSGNQKIILSLDEHVTAVSGRSVSVSAGGSSYTAPAESASALGGSSRGPWYFVFDLSDFSPELSLTAGTDYTVGVPAGTFVDAAGNGSAELSAVFTTSASGGHAVVFTQAGGTLSVRTGTGDSVASGQAVADGVQLTFTAAAGDGYSLRQTVLENGTETETADLSAYMLSGDLEVYYARSPLAFGGTATISGDAKAGVTLTGGVDGANQSDSSKWTFTWVRRDGVTDTALVSGGSGTSYMLTEADIGKTIRLEVTDSVYTGTLYKETASVAKADYAGSAVAAPAVASLGETEITLTATDGYEYSAGGSLWQDSPSFTGLTSGQSYDFYQRVGATDTVNASPASDKTTVATVSALTGTVSISGTAQSGQVLTGSIAESNCTGTLTYTWKRGDTTVGTGATYTPTAADIGCILTLEVTSSVQTGSRSATSAAVLKAVCPQPVPAAPTLASASATSITLAATDGYQYSLGGTTWQDTTTFHNLSIGTSYTFYQRVKETDTELSSASSPGASLSTLPALSGVIMISGEARYGMTIVANLSDTNNTGTLTYTWKRGALTVGTGAAYVVSAIDIGNQLSLEVTSSAQGGSIERSFGTVQKAYYFGETPSAPTRYSRTTSKIVLKSVSGCEYSRNGTTWQDSTTFSGLSSGTTYTFYQRYKATTTMEASPASAALKTATSSSGSSTDDSSSTSSSATPTPDASSSTALYSYTLTSDDTRILYSVMKNLAAGNKTQDVTIKQSNVEITFLKGTMTDSYTKLWYDFGTSINNSIAEQTAKRIAGDAFVATIHFNYDGALPGTASIRFWLGAENAGKTLYYYKLEDDDTLTFMQTSVADSTGWATVTQTSCSDYVFLDRDAAAASVSPTPSPTASAGVSPTPTPLISANDTPLSGLSTEGWFIAALVLLAIALIVGGIWLYTKNRDEY